MLKNANFLCEIGTEEIPAGYLQPAIESINKTFTQQLTDNRIDFDDILVMATPRRIAILISNLAEKQREEEAELKGPALSAAYDAEGKPAKPLLGFLKGNGVDEKDIFKKDTGKGAYIFAKKVLDSKPAVEILPGIITGIVSGIPFPKRMRWSGKSIDFPRPINYFAIIFNGNIVPFELEGIPSSNKIRGHYIRHNKMIPLTDIGEYENLLKENGVIVNQLERRELINSELRKAAELCGCVLSDDDTLLDTVTYLVESPFIVNCDFAGEFLKVPDIALIAEMKEHQKYFPLHSRDGKLSSKFLVVSNNPATPYIKAGNERVITARFSDARFFYTEDRKAKLADSVESLKSVLFHKELGSIYDKVTRMQSIASAFVQMTGLAGGVAEKIKRAVSLCKADLNTAMVFEFSSLQGKIGRIYALEDGEDSEVADAIEDHYRPRSQDDKIPEGMVSAAVSIAEKLDNIFGSFSVGNIPKGSADPYALRRQANAVVEILIKNEINIPLRELLSKIAPAYKDGENLTGQIMEFITARAKTIFTGSGFRYDEIDACLSTNYSDFTELYRRAKSLNTFRQNEKFSAMLLGFKRMNNILSGFRKDNAAYSLAFNAALLKEKEEKELFAFFDSRKEEISRLIAESKYIELFEFLIQGKSAIDAFFDKVLVMDERTDVRDTRLAMLEGILSGFSGLLDFSKISDK
ncbi:MAG: glycine--tRNA ligase subunit beta [Spirochaetia bacterium]|jgi:glycyl-tRNA synthetase beta chain|nr:glycine--tRNA ligase subunit beta [Spirochaetia bacterium]